MRKVNIPKFRKEVIVIIEANRGKVSRLEINDDNSVITFYGKKYKCEVTLNDKWIGYWMNIDSPKDYMDCSIHLDTDIYPIYGGAHEKIVLEIYDDLIDTIKAIFSGEIYYINKPDYQYICRKNKNDTYSVTCYESKKFLFWKYAKGWFNEEFPADEFEKLDLRVLS